MKQKRVITGAIAAGLFALTSCTGGNQGMNEAGSADSNKMMNIDTQYVDTSGATPPGAKGEAADNAEGTADTSATPGKNQVPVPSP